jgi:hypothetical protein
MTRETEMTPNTKWVQRRMQQEAAGNSGTVWNLEDFAEYGLSEEEEFTAVWRELRDLGLAEPHVATERSWRLTEVGVSDQVK